ncbi:adenylate/guanylate cyclase domain-containing protein [Rhizobium leguminosarum]|uniref:adenylate/guanylate cyclase domain-containing protein n=1 Tax=Rhizobium leguminosarum TaxID=384 RepID=UPI001C950D4F|nr:adenylate/guanylate cyclase domain-containing protein [Rhizobium leguminosarum]MBY5827576.1 tetratricopeptide repeat protein [Rhizobium leguminosarum]
MQRKLAIIVAGDVVGYTKLMADNEAETYAALRSAFDESIKPILERHSGRIFKNAGDGFLAVVPSVSEALDAATEIQAAFEATIFDLRIGINIGDVIEDQGDMFGEGVNVASRLESIARPGGILVSSAVVRSADRSRKSSFVRLGRRMLKNIPEALEIYELKATSDSVGLPFLSALLPPGGRRRLALGACLLAVASVASLAVAYPRWTDGVIAAAAANFGLKYADSLPVVAVLPFDNMSGDSHQTYFVDGLTEDIISELARNPDLQVIARNSTFAFRDQPSDTRVLGERLGAGYIVEGSARQVGDQLRVVAQLIDTRNGTHLWSRSYDRKIDDVFAVQTDLTTEIVAHLVSYVRRSEATQAIQRPTESLQAYDLALQARSRYKHGQSDGEDLRASRVLLQRALKIDPAYAVARASLGMTYIVDFAQSVTGSATKVDLETGLSEVRQAIRLNPTLPAGYQALSMGLAVSGEYEAAIQAARRAVELNPNDPDSLMALAKAQLRFGEYTEAVANAERARKLHPLAPEYYTYVHGQALYAAGRFDDAAVVLDECLLRSPREENCLLIAAAVQAARNDVPQAQLTMAQLLAAEPDFSLADERDLRRFGNLPLMEKFLKDLGRAKAPETAANKSLDRAG